MTDRLGKPHPEQDQIGGLKVPGLSSGWSLEAMSNRRPRKMATVRRWRIQNSAYRPTGTAIEPIRPGGGGSFFSIASCLVGTGITGQRQVSSKGWHRWQDTGYGYPDS